MEDDDEFGDLYTDVLMPFSSKSTTSLSSTTPQPHRPSPAPVLHHRPIDLNLKNQDDDSTPSGASRQIPAAQTLTSIKSPPLAPAAAGVAPVSIPNRDLVPEPMVLDTEHEVNDVKDVKFDIEEGVSNGIEGMGSDDPIIPGLTDSVRQEDSARNNNGNNNGFGGDEAVAEGEGDDWDSDSEDDLQIVLNDNNHGPMAMERGGMMGEDDDEDGDPLVIVADGNANLGMEEQEWAEEGGQAADGERKEGGESVKVVGSGGGIVVAPKVGYSGHGYHPFHSQFKYVRPGAAPMPGTTVSGPGGAPGQVRPLMGAMAGRGRGDWRPSGMKAAAPMQKGFHPSFGMPNWGNNMAGRGSGVGLEFTLPSHKTIFEVDIDSFEEKPWKYPGVDLSDFFNFGLNEESWKDYCKKLEHRRLETTMQSKIRVYESGRTEQDYDPDLPPELAAATGQEVPADAANPGKLDGGQNDMSRGTARVRAPLPTGRAIQVESGYGERLPSIDTRPPRIRDSDAIIEIVCQDSLGDDSSTGNGALDRTENGLQREDVRGDLASDADAAREDTEYFNGFPDAYDSRKRQLVGRRTTSTVRNNVPEEDGGSPFPAEVSISYGPGSRGQSPMYPNGSFDSPREERHRQGSSCDRSKSMTPIHGKRDKLSDTQEEESVESMDGKSPYLVRDVKETSIERKDDVDEEHELADRTPVIKKDDVIYDTHKDENSLNPMKNRKTSSQVEQRMLQELDDDEDSRAARSSENSKARSGSSRDYHKWRDGAEEEVIQGGCSRMGIVKKPLDEHDLNFRRKDHDGRLDIGRNRMVGKAGEDSYPHRDFDASLSHNMHIKTEGFDPRRERDNSDGMWQRREDDLYSRKSRTEESRKRERDDEMGSRNRAKVREVERGDKDDYVHSRKQLDNGIYKVHHDKDVRHRERDDNLKSRYEGADGYHSKRRKDEEFFRRDYADKEEILHGQREPSSNRRKRERDEIADQQKRDEQQRIRDNFDDHRSFRHKDEVWLQRERVERQRERDEWHRLKQSHEDSILKRERDEGRATMRSGRGSEDKPWIGHTRAKDEYKGSEKDYQLKESIRYGEQGKRRERNDDESFSRHRGREDSYARGHQNSNEERKSRQERASTRNDHASSASDSQRGNEKKHKENSRKNRESEGGHPITLGSDKRNQEDLSGHNNDTGLRSDEKVENSAHYNSSKRHREDASSDDEQQDSKRGRSKLERWTSHKERDYSINSKSTASLKLKEMEKINNVGSSESNKMPDEPGKSVEPAENHNPLSEDKNVGEVEIKDVDARPKEDRHLDTVEKLKKRSERFKLPLPGEKDAIAIRKMESEALPAAKNETPTESEIKHERPARKRRWISN